MIFVPFFFYHDETDLHGRIQDKILKKFTETEKLKYEFVLVYTTEYYVTAFPQQP